MSSPRTIYFILFWMCAVGLTAQNTNYTEFFGTSWQHIGSAGLADTTAILDQSRFRVSGGYGWTLNENGDMLSLGAGYALMNLKNSTEPDDPLEIHDIQLGVDYARNWSLYWASTFSMSLNFVSDLQTEATSAYQTNLSVLFHHGKQESLIWTFGLLYSDQPFGTWLFPVLGVDWQINPDLYFSGILFSNLYLEHALISQQLYWGIDVAAEGYSFVISDYQGAMDSYLTSFSEELPFFPFNYRLFVDYYFSNGLVLYTKAGYLATRGFRHYSTEHDRLGGLYDRAIDAAFNVEVGLAWRLRNF